MNAPLRASLVSASRVLRSVFGSLGLAGALAMACRPQPPTPATSDSGLLALVEAEPGATAARSDLTLVVNLSELPPERIAELRAALGADAVDPAGGTIRLGDQALSRLVELFVKGVLVDHGLDAFDFYGRESYPRLAYWENVVVQLPEFVRYGQFAPYSGYSGIKGSTEQMLAYLAFRAARSPEQLERLFARYADVIFALVSPETYESGGYGRFTRGLLASHAFITAHPRYPAVMEDLDGQIQQLDATDMFSGERTATSYATYEGLGLIAPEVQQSFVRAGGGYAIDDENTDVVWFSSFWLRRHREGNTEAVRSILTAIDGHYGRPRDG